MQKKAGASPRGRATATPSLKTPGVKDSLTVASCHSSKNAMSFPLWIERMERARALGSGHTGLVMIWPLSGTGRGATVSQAGSEGWEGTSPSERWARITIPCELTIGTWYHVKPNNRTKTISPQTAIFVPAWILLNLQFLYVWVRFPSFTSII